MKTHVMVAAAALAIAWTAVSSVPAHPVAGAMQVTERCGGRTVTIPGTNASETLTGTAGADVILARGGLSGARRYRSTLLSLAAISLIYVLVRVAAGASALVAMLLAGGASRWK